MIYRGFVEIRGARGKRQRVILVHRAAAVHAFEAPLAAPDRYRRFADAGKPRAYFATRLDVVHAAPGTRGHDIPRAQAAHAPRAMRGNPGHQAKGIAERMRAGHGDARLA